jgi:orotidine-5'-phosphate decarboxylase
MPLAGAAVAPIAPRSRKADVRFFERLDAAARRNQSRLCVGLDPDPARIDGDVTRFLTEVVAATVDVVACFKPNLAFFEALGDEGVPTLRAVLGAIGGRVPVIGDAKRNDIGSTAAMYARSLFERWGFDAATVTPWGGRDSVEPFTDYADHGVYLWCRSSNPGAADFQDLLVAGGEGPARPLYEVVAERARQWNRHGNIGLVAGATYPEQAARLRRLCPSLPFLIPGVGAQGASLEEAITAARMASGGGYVVNASRGVLYAGRGAGAVAAARAEAIRLRDAIADADRAAAPV